MKLSQPIHASILGLNLAVLAFAASVSAQFDPKAEEPIPRLRGTLFLGGGGELPASVRQGFLQMSGGDKARLVLLSAPNTNSAEVTTWKKLQVEHFTTIPWASATEPKNLAQLAKATGVWILGDDATGFADAMRRSPVEKALQALIARRGVLGCNGPVVRALSKVMIRGGKPHAEVGVGLDLVPGAVLDDRFTVDERRNRLLGVLAARPKLVGLGIDEGSTLVLHQRYLDVLGEGSAYGCVIGSDKRLLRIDRINRRESPASQRRRARAEGNGRQGSRRFGQRSRRRTGTDSSFRPRPLADLIALSRSARARVAPRFPAYEPEPPNVKKGTLIIVGGGGMPRGLLDRFIELAGGKDAALLYVPCEERDEVRGGEPRMLASWRRGGATNVDWIHTKDRRKADGDEVLLAKIRKAKGIWFGGGRQWNFVDSYQNTTAHQLMHEVLARGGVIGGSSAGASIQGSYLARANPLGNRDSMAEGYEIGLGFLTGVAIDQHFSQRGRLPDMTALVNTYPELLGIGLDEASSIVVQGKIATAFSRDGRKVHIYDRRKPVIPGEKDYILLSHGQRFDLQERKVLEPVKAKDEPKKSEKK